MRQAVPLFGRAPQARPSDPGAERRSLAAPAGLDVAALDCLWISAGGHERGHGHHRAAPARAAKPGGH